MTNGVINLDYQAAKTAQRIVQAAANKQAKSSDLDNTATNALGVLQEMGTYAAMLYLCSTKNNRELAEIVRDETLSFLQNIGLPEYTGSPGIQSEILSYISNNVTQCLDRTLLVKQVLEQMLTYLRYGAKAM